VSEGPKPAARAKAKPKAPSGKTKRDKSAPVRSGPRATASRGRSPSTKIRRSRSTKIRATAVVFLREVDLALQEARSMAKAVSFPTGAV
jgi:hypothetical protein